VRIADFGREPTGGFVALRGKKQTFFRCARTLGMRPVRTLNLTSRDGNCSSCADIKAMRAHFGNLPSCIREFPTEALA
jgi:hypothetical protein